MQPTTHLYFQNGPCRHSAAAACHERQRPQAVRVVMVPARFTALSAHAQRCRVATFPLYRRRRFVAPSFASKRPSQSAELRLLALVALGMLVHER